MRSHDRVVESDEKEKKEVEDLIACPRAGCIIARSWQAEQVRLVYVGIKSCQGSIYDAC